MLFQILAKQSQFSLLVSLPTSFWPFPWTKANLPKLKWKNIKTLKTLLYPQHETFQVCSLTIRKTFKNVFPLLPDNGKCAAMIILLWAALFASACSTGACLSIFSPLVSMQQGLYIAQVLVEPCVCCAPPHLKSVSSALVLASCQIPPQVSCHL